MARRPMRIRRLLASAAAAAVCAVSCAKSNSTPTGPTDPPPIVPLVVTLAGAGDIADCGNDNGRHAEDTARLIEKLNPNAVFTAGDNAYPQGSVGDFINCYHPRWGRFRSKTFPAPGNHEYETDRTGFPYFDYFGDRAGDTGLGYYSYNLGNWHVVSLNSMAPLSAGQEQFIWLQRDLAASRTKCTLVYWHHPRFTSGPSQPTVGSSYIDLWRLLIQNNVEIVINGHDHGYERFGPQDENGNANPTAGVRQYTVGSGGAPLYDFAGNARNSEFKLPTYGILVLTLRIDNWDSVFVQAGTEAQFDRQFGVACR